MKLYKIIRSYCYPSNFHILANTKEEAIAFASKLRSENREVIDLETGEDVYVYSNKW